MPSGDYSSVLAITNAIDSVLPNPVLAQSSRQRSLARAKSIGVQRCSSFVLRDVVAPIDETTNVDPLPTSSTIKSIKKIKRSNSVVTPARLSAILKDLEAIQHPSLPTTSNVPTTPASFVPHVKFENMTKTATQVQQELLRTILHQNASCEYLRKYDIATNVDGEQLIHEFRKHVPLVNHADLQPYIERIVNGDRPVGGILTSTPIEALCLSSGTTNTKEKYLLYHEGLKAGTLEVASIAASFRESVYPLERPISLNGTKKEIRILEFLFCGKYFLSKGGLKVGTATTHMIRGGAFKLRQEHNGLKSCSPEEVVLGSVDCKQTMYCHLLCGLIYASEVQVVSAPFAYTLVEAFKTLEVEWKSLCNDIRFGTLNEAKVQDNTLKMVMERDVLREPNPRLADTLFAKCAMLAHANQAWNGAIQMLWPKCKYVLSIVTGAMEVYTTKLQYYAGAKLPIVAADYGATEGWVGVNVDPRASINNNVSFTILPSLAFFEFIPLSRRSTTISDVVNTDESAAVATYDEGEPICMTEVKVGQEYEIVMTTSWGLYRYRLGDIVRVTGFYNSAPQVAYVCRKNVVLSINIDKNTENDLKAVVDQASIRLSQINCKGESDLELVDYTSYADRSTNPGHYVVFWELKRVTNTNKKTKLIRKSLLGEGVEEQLEMSWLRECATIMDQSFVEPGYVISRKMGTIGALELCVVHPGTFNKLLDRFLARGAAITQYKTPRCLVGRPDAISILRTNTVVKAFSLM